MSDYVLTLLRPLTQESKEEKELGEKADLSRVKEKYLCKNNAQLPVFLLIPPFALPSFFLFSL